MQAIWAQLSETMLLDIPLSRWLITAAVILATVIARTFVLSAFQRLSRKLAARTITKLDDVLLSAAERPVGLLVYVFGILLAVHILNPPAEIFPLVAIADSAGRIISILLTIWFLWRLLEGLSAYFTARAQETESAMDDQLVPFIGKTLKIFLVLTGLLVVAQNMGYSISGLLASLGIGGIAIAMAAKDTIANVFGSIMILVDRPFTVGDWIKTTEFEGVVEEIGFRSTKIRTFERTLVNVPNSSLANMVIDNIDARNERRIKMRIGLTYDTTPAKMDAAIKGIEAILVNHPGVDQSYKLVKFDEFSDSSLSIFLYYFSASKVWEEYLQVRQEINLQIMHLLEEMELDFAFPTRTLYIEQEKPQ
ncbi:mechanosensitive ion channel family protein [Mariprofundus sp. KV]|uniref:mechanosensitive ion channel family protein n=1 Tax=Mariprofundus sp. KV TaxID=2608715 RepID=UPI0015A35DE2|nr:mechanosensitive ion channel family protein [Mariprofundus sp. KV]NWF35193.1 mechanosensitive ion channel family protein [Mariprofundus sp. KV]